jgi:hypothetical protein
VALCNKAVHESAWAKGDRSSGGGGLIALELARQAYQAHALPYGPVLSNIAVCDPRRFTWLYDPTAVPEQCVKVRDNKTGRIAVWPYFFA